MDMGVRPELSPQFGKKKTYLLATCNNLKKRKEMSNAQDFTKY